MTYKITIELSDIEKKSLEHDVKDINEWANHVIKNRARISKTEIIPLVINLVEIGSLAAPNSNALLARAYKLPSN